MAAYTRPKQVRRKYGPSPSLSEQATVGDDDFVDPFRSSNDVLGFAEAGPSTRPAEFQFAPNLTKITPATGVAAGGTVTIVTGKHMLGVTGVTFGGTAGTALTVIDDFTVRVTTPAKTAGTYDVVVTGPGGTDTLTGAFIYT